MADARQLAVGAASGTVTVGLALFLVLLSQRPEPAPASPAPPPKPVPAEASPAPPSQAAVRLPPPPAPESAPESAESATTSAAPPESPPETAAAEPAPPAIVPLTPRRAAPAPRRGEAMPRAPREPVEIVERRPEPAPEASTREPAPVEDRPAVAALPPQPAPQTVMSPTPEAMAEGRALLRLLEAGEGPLIEIAWPAEPRVRARLYDTLRRCHGMQTALLGADGALYAATGTAGRPWDVNRDAISGFVRRPAGALPGNEREVIDGLRRRHGMPAAAPVRLFPREVDAVLLAGLRSIVGEDYAGRAIVRARYSLGGARVSIGSISADGRATPGRIALPATRRGCG